MLPVPPLLTKAYSFIGTKGLLGIVLALCIGGAYFYVSHLNSKIVDLTQERDTAQAEVAWEREDKQRVVDNVKRLNGTVTWYQNELKKANAATARVDKLFRENKGGPVGLDANANAALIHEFNNIVQ